MAKIKKKGRYNSISDKTGTERVILSMISFDLQCVFQGELAVPTVVSGLLNSDLLGVTKLERSPECRLRARSRSVLSLTFFCSLILKSDATSTRICSRVFDASAWERRS